MKLLRVTKREAKLWLRELRTAAGLTQADVAHQLGVTPRTIMNMENPKEGFPNGFTMLSYLEVLGAIQTPKPDGPEESEAEFLERAESVLREVRRRLRPPEDPPEPLAREARP